MHATPIEQAPATKWQALKEPSIRANDRVLQLFQKYGYYCPIRELYCVPNNAALRAKIQKNEERIRTQPQKMTLHPLPAEVMGLREIAPSMRCTSNSNYPNAAACASLPKNERANGDSYGFFSLDMQFEGQMRTVSFFAVLDGHGTDRDAQAASTYCRNNLKDVITEACKGLDGELFSFANALTVAFALLDSMFKHEKPQLSSVAGTTLCLAALIGSEYLVVANCGDSRAVLGRGVGFGEQELSYDYAANRKEAQNVVTKRGGVIIDEGVAGKYGTLGMTRALGDFDCKNDEGMKVVSCRPKIDIVKLEFGQFALESGCIILGSDGLFNAISSRDAAIFVSTLLAQGKTPGSIAKSLVQHAKDRNSYDDITAFVIPLKLFV